MASKIICYIVEMLIYKKNTRLNGGYFSLLILNSKRAPIISPAIVPIILWTPLNGQIGLSLSI